MSSIPEQIYFATELFYSQQFFSFPFALFVWFNPLLNPLLSPAPVAFHTGTFSFPFSASRRTKTAAHGWAQEDDGSSLQPSTVPGQSSVVQWGLPALFLLFDLKSEIKHITINETEGHLEIRKDFSSWNTIFFCERPPYPSSECC